MPDLTWEEAVQWLRDQPDQQDLVRACYFDDPLLAACERFSGSGEWHETARCLPVVGHALDVGAGARHQQLCSGPDGMAGDGA